ncbi:TetR/AcrR family transcriptional regulator [Pararoseomonas indoligenes]|uniref:TetR/AcrR family transcriptional regulator n=1 Tax=Roseomonas indoligenes TaxID=2820811 RepID=A0A940S719_9PROT|nr:TetR/AcrR family transcriptional regulator [Pararoseomonas indoligenes]MBP0496151.1 TetR/AcrR family transcriptional regulator [Pararoseomonas indoligenes]
MVETRPDTPRRPLRARGRSRYEALLDAVDALVRQGPPASISLQDVAREAGAPLASVYHYFPNSTAAFLGLAQRYHRFFEAVYEEPIPEMPETWPGLNRLWAARGRRVYETHPATMRLFLGADVAGRIREADLDANRRFGEHQYRLLRQHFLIPEDPSLVDRLAIGVTISDSIWSLSYIRHGRLTDEMVEEAARAKEAYLAAFIPPRAARRGED